MVSLVRRVSCAFAFLLLVMPLSAQTVSVPNFPSAAQLESGFLSAFTPIIVAQYGAPPVWGAKGFAQATSGIIDFTATFTAGGVSGTISAQVFDPATATPLGGGAFQFAVKSSWTCGSWNCSCGFYIRDYRDGTREYHCDCEDTGDCTLTENDLEGTYSIRPGDYGFPVVDLY